MSDTPRTDDAIRRVHKLNRGEPINELARQLERELADLRERLKNGCAGCAYCRGEIGVVLGHITDSNYRQKLEAELAASQVREKLFGKHAEALAVTLRKLNAMTPKRPNAITWERGNAIITFVQDELCPILAAIDAAMEAKPN
jgi:hypothetical protein